MKILITSGATREPIDGVRFITNFSTGETGALLADHFSDRGHEVTCLVGMGAIRPKRTPEVKLFESFNDLNKQMEDLLGKRRFDAVIHAAAVSDFSIAAVRIGGQELLYAGSESPTFYKLDSSAEEIELRLSRNFKIVDRIKVYAKNSQPKVVAFKLTQTEKPAERHRAVIDLAQHSSADVIVHNDLLEIKRTGEHKFSIFKSQIPGVLNALEMPVRICGSRNELAAALLEVLSS